MKKSDEEMAEIRDMIAASLNEIKAKIEEMKNELNKVKARGFLAAARRYWRDWL